MFEGKQPTQSDENDQVCDMEKTIRRQKAPGQGPGQKRNREGEKGYPGYMLSTLAGHQRKRQYGQQMLRRGQRVHHPCIEFSDIGIHQMGPCGCGQKNAECGKHSAW
jgi:hypothetical protein